MNGCPAAGIDPDRDVKLCVIPPPQMPSHMKNGYVDLFCAGEPWNTVATEEGHGTLLAATTDILPAHPEKVLAVSERFARQQPGILPGLVRAVLRGCAWCQDSKNRDELAGMLARPEYMNLPAALIQKSLLLGRDLGANKHQKSARPSRWCSPDVLNPRRHSQTKMHTAWMMREMIRWGHLHPETDMRAIAMRCVDTQPYRAAAADLKIDCPAEDFSPMPLRHGQMLTLEHLKNPIAKPKTTPKLIPVENGVN